MASAKVTGKPAVIDSGQHGFSLFELVVVICLFSILVGVFVHRFLFLQELAEKTAMETTVINMRTGMRYQLAELMVQGRSYEMSAMLERNPIVWLTTPPANYAGEFDEASAEPIPPGNWYFDKKRRELVYQPRHHEYIQDSKIQPEYRYAIRGWFTQQNDNQSQLPILTGIRLVEVTGVKWF